MLEGLEDGKKRALFVLINFLRKCKWSWEEIEDEIWSWNERNKEPLRDSYISSQLNYFKKHEDKLKDIPPPNCDNNTYYRDIGVCGQGENDECKRIKNPLSYAIKKYAQSKKMSREIRKRR